MIGRTLLIATAALAVGMPATAQERGTIEFGGFGNHTSWDSDLLIDGGGAEAFVSARSSFLASRSSSTSARGVGIARTGLRAWRLKPSPRD